MDVKSYYHKIKEIEAQLKGEYLVMVSVATPEGARDGVLTEVRRATAAKLIGEGKARVATSEETEEFHNGNREAVSRFEDEEAARRVQVMVIPSPDSRKAKDRS